MPYREPLRLRTSGRSFVLIFFIFCVSEAAPETSRINPNANIAAAEIQLYMRARQLANPASWLRMNGATSGAATTKRRRRDHLSLLGGSCCESAARFNFTLFNNSQPVTAALISIMRAAQRELLLCFANLLERKKIEFQHTRLIC